MSELLPFERTSAKLTVPDWYDFHYFRRIGRKITALSLGSALMAVFGVFIILSATWVAFATTLVDSQRVGVLTVVVILELIIAAGALWMLYTDYESKRKERRITPYGRKLLTWIESDFLPFMQRELSVYFEVSDAEELIVKKRYVHLSFRGSAILTLEYDGQDLVVHRNFEAGKLTPGDYEHELTETLTA